MTDGMGNSGSILVEDRQDVELARQKTAELARLRTGQITIELRRAARKARLVQPVVTGGGGFRVRKGDKLFSRIILASLVLVWLLPSLLAAFYLFAIANDQYISEARFAIRSDAQDKSMVPTELSSLLDSGPVRDGLIIAEFIRSRAFIDQIEKSFDLKKMFERDDYDYIGKMPPGATAETMLDFWKRQIDIQVDRMTGLVSIQIRAFRPEDSLALAKATIKLSEDMVNQLTRLKDEQELTRSVEQLRNAKDRLGGALTAIRDARNAVGLLDVDVAAKSYSDVLTALRLELSQVDQEISGLKSGNLTSSPQMGALVAKSQALRDQISVYEAKVAGKLPESDVGDNLSLASQSSQLMQKETDVDIAKSAYVEAVANYERARNIVERQRAYILTYVAPQLAEESLYPKRGWTWLAITFAAFVAWGMFCGVAFLIRDNTA